MQICCIFKCFRHVQTKSWWEPRDVNFSLSLLRSFCAHATSRNLDTSSACENCISLWFVRERANIYIYLHLAPHTCNSGFRPSCSCVGTIVAFGRVHYSLSAARITNDERSSEQKKERGEARPRFTAARRPPPGDATGCRHRPWSVRQRRRRLFALSAFSFGGRETRSRPENSSRLLIEAIAIMWLLPYWTLKNIHLRWLITLN